jgi:hypothetical protein
MNGDVRREHRACCNLYGQPADSPPERLHQKSDDTLKNFLNHKDTKDTKTMKRIFVFFAPLWLVLILISFELLSEFDGLPAAPTHTPGTETKRVYSQQEGTHK